MSKKVIIINGPNMNLLGKREQDIYGQMSFDDYFLQLKQSFPEIELLYFQSNVEGELVNAIHEHGFEGDGIVFNAAAYTHTSVALHDAIKAVDVQVIEVHMSNTAAREDFRHQSLIAAACKGTIAGFGLFSYNLAIEALLK
jgi:3-dehydroquinate dehydratase-2